ncbi:MAG: metallophosphoesterase family protein [Catalinimonas sp.]
MKIGLLSDTHGFLDPEVFRYLEPCQEVWHAGDVGTPDVLDQLAAFRPLRAVSGNIDGGEVRLRCPEELRFDCAGLDVWMIHIGGYPGRYAPAVRQRLDRAPPPDLLVCGHSHILKVQPDPKRRPLLTLNPGAAGRHGFHHVRTLLRFEVADGQIKQMQAVELGPRSARVEGRSA